MEKMTEEDRAGDNESPTQPGVYWFQSESMFWAVMVEVRLTNGEMMVWWPPKQDEPVANLKGHWRSPLRSSTGPLD